MAKLPPIRITKRDEEEYRRLRRNTKAKINRTKKNYGVDLEDEIPLPDLSEFQTRKEFNEWKDLQKSFTNRGNTEYQFVKNEYNVVASKREIYQIEQATKQAQRVADKKIAEQLDRPTFHDGEQIGTVRDRTMYMPESDVTGIHRPADFDFKKVRNRRRLDDIKTSMERRKHERYYDDRNKTMLDNFISMLRESFHSDADELIKELESLNPDDFYGLYLSNFTVFNFDIYYKSDVDIEINRGQVQAMLDPVKEFKNSDMYDG